MRTKLIAFLLCALMVCTSVCAMAQEQSEVATIVATTYPLYDMAKTVGGTRVNVIYLPNAVAEDAKDADVVLCLGSEADEWTGALEDVTVIRAMDGIDWIEGDYDITTIPVNCMICASFFADALGGIDIDGNAYYQENLSAYISELCELDMMFRSAISEGTKVYCEEGSLAYFAREYGVEIAEDAADAVVLNTYAYPEAGNLEIPYIQLMAKNVEMFSNKNK